MEACQAMMLLLQDNSAGQVWAPRLLMLHGPARALRWAKTGTIEAAAAYALVQRMVESGGAALAHEAWRLCKLTLESPQALRTALTGATSVSSSRDAASVAEGQ